MDFKPLKDRLATLPLILAGPIVRRTEQKQVTVWVALKASRKVTLRIYKGISDFPQKEDGMTPSELKEIDEKIDELLKAALLFSGTATTITLGNSLHLTAVTASTTEENKKLSWGKHYYYDLFFDEPGGDDTPVVDMIEKSLRAEKQHNILSTEQISVELTYGKSPLPSFVLPAATLDKLRIVHSSCRKPHGEGEDMLAKVDELIEKSSAPEKRPQQLFLTGDQIYADDVAPTMLAMLQDASNALLGWKEKLPGIEIDDERLLPNNRQQVAEGIAKLTAGDVAGNHLFTAGEYWAMYLFVWSDVLWDQKVWGETPILKNDSEKKIDKLYMKLQKVRKALANISTYMICDDHEITDDWFLNLQWCVDVFSSQLGRRILLNGMLGYALFQAWGNNPDIFNHDGPVSYPFLETVEKWRPIGEPFTNSDVERALELSLGIADADMIKKVKRARSLHVLHTESQKMALNWHYYIPGSKHQVIVLDTRTWRYFPGDPVKDDADELEDGNNAPALLGKEALIAQILPYKPTDNPFEITFVVSAAPVIPVEHLSELRSGIGLFGSGGKIMADYEDWEYQKEAVWLFYATLSAIGRVSELSGGELYLSRIVFLSGDVHYGYASKIDYERTALSSLSEYPGFPDLADFPDLFGLKKGTTAVFVQLNSSGLKNQDKLTKYAQSLGYKQRKKTILPFKHRETNASYKYIEHILANYVKWDPLNCSEDLNWMQMISCIASNTWESSFYDEIIGRNNIGEVYFESNNKKLSQKLYWKDDDNEKHSSHYIIELDFNPA